MDLPKQMTEIHYPVGEFPEQRVQLAYGFFIVAPAVMPVDYYAKAVRAFGADVTAEAFAYRHHNTPTKA